VAVVVHDTTNAISINTINTTTNNSHNRQQHHHYHNCHRRRNGSSQLCVYHFIFTNNKLAITENETLSSFRMISVMILLNRQ